jgi:uncharacterized protein (DUF3820 family)
MEEGLYTITTLITFGKHKFKRLYEVPADYLLLIHQNPKGCPDRFLVKCIEHHLEKIKSPDWGTIIIQRIEEDRCTKSVYPTKKDARIALQAIRNSPGKHKKPIRSYECDKCSGWHLTSMPIEEWKEKEGKQKQK